MKNIKDIKQLIAKTASEFADDESINKHKLEQMVWDSLLSDPDNRADFLEILAFEELKSEVGKHFNKHVNAVKGTDMAQIELKGAGFKHIQSRYAISVSGETELISTHLMTGLQFDQQISLHTKQGKGHLEHADELSRLKLMLHGDGETPANDPEFFDHE